MSEPGPKMTAAFANRDHRAEIVERLYDVAVDPIRLEQLLDIWEVRAAPLRVGQLDLALVPDAPEIEARVARATVFLDRLEATEGKGAPRSGLAADRGVQPCGKYRLGRDRRWALCRSAV